MYNGVERGGNELRKSRILEKYYKRTVCEEGDGNGNAVSKEVDSL